MTEVAEWLAAGMRARRLTQRALAEQSGVDHSTISRLLRGERTPSFKTVHALAKVLGEMPATGWSAESTHPSRTVEHALRRDPSLTNEDVVQVMNLYLGLHRSRQEVSV